MSNIQSEPVYDVQKLNNIHKEAISEIDKEIRTTRKCRMKRDHVIGNLLKKRGTKCSDEYETISTSVKECLKHPKKCDYATLINNYNEFAQGHELENGNEKEETLAKPLESLASASISISSSSPSSPKSIPPSPPTIEDILKELNRVEPNIEKMNEYVNTCENHNDLYKILAKINRKINSEKELIQRLLPKEISPLNKRDEEYLTKKTELLEELEKYRGLVSKKFESIRSRNRGSKVQGGKQQSKQKTLKTKKRSMRRKTRQ